MESSWFVVRLRSSASSNAIQAEHGLRDKEIWRMGLNRCRIDSAAYATAALRDTAAGTRACAASRQAGANWDSGTAYYPPLFYPAGTSPQRTDGHAQTGPL